MKIKHKLVAGGICLFLAGALGFPWSTVFGFLGGWAMMDVYRELY